MRRELGVISLSHRLHHQFGHGSHVQTFTNKTTPKFARGLAVGRQICALTGLRGELQAAGTELRLADRLEESGVLSGGQVGRQLADVARHELRLLVPDEQGHVRLEHIHAHVLLAHNTDDIFHLFIGPHWPSSSVCCFTFRAKPTERKKSSR